MGFIPDIERIVSFIPMTRQTLLFSATMPPEIELLTKKFLSNPKTISVAPPASPAQTVDHRLLMVNAKDKKFALRELIEHESVKNAFVFCNRKKDVDMLGRWLKEKGFSAAALHGDMVQSKRTETLQAFKDGQIAVLVCSDVAARGLDVSGVSHVFNFDVPFNADDYVHRIGRTGRAGASGKAWTLVTADEDILVAAIQKLVGKEIPTEHRGATPSAEGDDKPEKAARAHKITEKASERTGRTTKAPHKPVRSENAPANRPKSLADADAEDKFGEENLPAFLRRN